MTEEQQAKERQQKWRSEPAYPQIGYEICGIGATGHYMTHPGIPQRTLIAAMCLQGMLANQGIIDVISESSIDWMAQHATKMGDALLTHLENTSK